VKQEWRDVVRRPRRWHAKLLSVAARSYTTHDLDRYTATWADASLGHGDGEHAHELSPRLAGALAGKEVAGAAAGDSHTAVWTDAGELFIHLWKWMLWDAGPRRAAA